MKNLTPLLKYLGLFIVLYAVLFALSMTRPVASFTNQVYRSVTEPVLQTAFPEAYLKLEEDAPPEADIFTIRAVFTSNRKIEESKVLARQQGQAQIDLKAQEYDLYLHLLFTSFLLFLWALILVTPVSIKQKLTGLLAGTFLFYLYTVVKIYIMLLDLFNRSGLGMYDLGDTSASVVEGLSYVLKSLGLSAFIVVFIWIIVTFRKQNWQQIVGLDRKD